MKNYDEHKIHIFSEGKSYKLYQGNMLDMLDVIEPNSIDAIVTDPPYELNFMNKGWDNSGIAFQKVTWEKCLKVLKPGGYLLAFGGSRTFHRIACAIEDAGFEIRDTILWLYGSGFPKSMNIGLAVDKKNGVESEVIGLGKSGNPESHTRSLELKDRPIGGEYEIKKAQNEWAGWGTALKPAYEPIIVSRKPCEGTCVDNVMKYGVGGINIDECRVPMEQSDIDMINAKSSKNPTDNYNHNESKKYGDYALNIATPANEQGRFPSNVILTYDDTDKEEVCGGMPESKGASSQNNFSNGHIYRGQSLQESSTSLSGYHEWYNDEGSAARYFYTAKASKRDRDEGLDAFETQYVAFSNQGKAELNRGNVDFRGNIDSPLNAFNKVQSAKNVHPTVKPTALMSYLIRLVTPKGGTILDPFNGSGSTGKAAMYENKDRNAGYKYIGIELTPEYLPISDARIRYAIGDTTPVEYKTSVKPKPAGQFSLFDLGE